MTSLADFSRGTLHEMDEASAVTARKHARELAREKEALRRRMRGVRQALGAPHRSAAAVAARHKLLALRELRQTVAWGGIIALYAAMRGELATDELATTLRGEGATVVYPRVQQGTRQLAFYRVNDASELRPGSLGILEPAPNMASPVGVAEISIFIVPGLAFDDVGNRLGWGKGHYDSTLSKNPEATRVGFAYQEQIVDSVPTDARDLPMHVVVTDLGELRRGRRWR